MVLEAGTRLGPYEILELRGKGNMGEVYRARDPRFGREVVIRKRLDYKRIRVDDPDGEYRVLLPGEPGYESADLEVESGWVRLWQPPGSSAAKPNDG